MTGERSFVDVLADRLQADGPDEFPRGYYEHLARERELRHQNAITVAYGEAYRAGCNSARVAIHVGQEVWDYLRSLATNVSGMSLPLSPESISRLWGYPLILEEDERPGHVSVRTIKVIA